VPSELRPLAQRAPRAVYDALFHAASETLLELGRTRTKATLGITTVLHTWTQELQLHPHVHALVTAGGLTESGWKPISLKYLFPVDVMGELLRGKMQTRLRELHRAGRLPESHSGLERLMRQLEQHDWVVYVKKAFRHAEHVLKYLGRYTHRVAIANSRLVSIGPDHVTFRTKSGKPITLDPVEFLWRFIQHVLPKGLQKIRHYGLYASAATASLERACQALHASESLGVRANITRLTTWQSALKELTGRDPSICPRCGGQIEHEPILQGARAPPETRHAE
jgi:Putative transposase